LKTYNKNKDLAIYMCIFPPQTIKPGYRTGGNQMAKRRCTVEIQIDSICRCDYIDNDAPTDRETSNGR